MPALKSDNIDINVYIVKEMMEILGFVPENLVSVYKEKETESPGWADLFYNLLVIECPEAIHFFKA